MTTGIEELKPPPKRKGRGPGKRPTLVGTSIRLPRYVVEYFNQFPNKQEVMRQVLTAYIESEIKRSNPTNPEGEPK